MGVVFKQYAGLWLPSQKALIFLLYFACMYVWGKREAAAERRVKCFVFEAKSECILGGILRSFSPPLLSPSVYLTCLKGEFSCLHLHFPTLFCCKTEMILCQDSRWAAAAAKRKFQSQITSHTLVREIFNFSKH